MGGHDPVLKSVTDPSVDLTVLFVARNEEKNIESCIRSSLDAVEEAKKAGIIRSAEFILVDSASTDRTVAIASRFPVRIVQLQATWPLSCGAGCHVGLTEARGRWCAIINADVTVHPRWFAEALPHITPDVGGITGLAKETLRGRNVIERLIVKNSSAPLSQGTLPEEVAKNPGGYSRGTFLLLTSAAREVGSFNPFFQAAEDMDLRLRLIRRKWRVLDLPILQCTHYWTAEGETLDLSSYIKTIFRNSIGLGQMARYNRRRDIWIAREAAKPVFNARILWNLASSTLLGGLLMAHILALALGRPWLLAMGLALDVSLGITIVRAARRRGVSRGDRLFAVLWEPLAFSVARTIGFFLGFARSPRGPRDYPWRAGSPLATGTALGSSETGKRPQL